MDLLSDAGHVIMPKMQYEKDGPKTEFRKVGRKKASTFTGFCSEHDSEIFREIDTAQFDSGNRDQLFLHAFRSATKELHACMDGAAKIHQTYVSAVEKGLEDDAVDSEVGMVATQNLIKAYEMYLFRVRYFDSIFDSSDRSKMFEHKVIEFEKQSPTIAVSSLFSLDYKGIGSVRIILNVFPVSLEKTVAIFSFPKAERVKSRYVLSGIFSAKDQSRIKLLLSVMIIRNIENFIVRPSYYEEWSDEKKRKIIDAFIHTLIVDRDIGEAAYYSLFE
ncbi:hypothetical protein [Ferrovibrio sp.]|uniref:hypothetical protein n=1 Tax=Ferrovibrio sp. TaxID=1917215 RepID=UPI003D0E0F02